MKAVAKGIGIALLLLLGFTWLLINAGFGKSPEERRAECAKALMSSIGTSTVNYQDKQAYDAHVKEKCEGFDIPNM